MGWPEYLRYARDWLQEARRTGKTVVALEGGLRHLVRLRRQPEGGG